MAYHLSSLSNDSVMYTGLDLGSLVGNMHVRNRLFQKKSNRVRVEDIYTSVNKAPGIIRFVTLPSENKLSPLEILKNCVTPLGENSKKSPKIKARG